MDQEFLLTMAARKRLHDAENALHAAIREEFRPGMTIDYWHGDHPIQAIVIETSGEHILVRGPSRKRYWLGYYRCIPYDLED